MGKNQLLIKIGLYLTYIAISLFFLYPLLWVVSYSLKTIPELFRVPPNILPETFNLSNYRHVITNTAVVRQLWNSFYIVFFGAVGTLVVTIPAAYAFSRLKFKASNTLMFIVLVFQMISPLVIAIPMYLYFSEIGLLNSHAALIAIYIALCIPTATWNIKGFLDTIPREIDESAIIDGCSRLNVVLKIHIPTTMPGIISVTLLIMVVMWSQFIVPFILLSNSQLFPISVGLVNLQNVTEAITTHFLAAATILGILPPMLAFIIFQRFIVSAMTEGAVKG